MNIPQKGQFIVTSPAGTINLNLKSGFDTQEEAEAEAVVRLNSYPAQIVVVSQVVKTLKASVSVSETEPLPPTTLADVAQ